MFAPRFFPERYFPPRYFPVGGGEEPPVGTPPTITTTSLPGGVQGEAYSQQIEYTDDGPVTLSIVAGSLPANVELDGDTLDGPLVVFGTFVFTVRAENAYGFDEQELSIEVEAAEPEVTGITIPSSATVYAGRSINIPAIVTGSYVTQEVDWTIESGDGSLVDDSANPVRFKAPSEPGETVIRGTSRDDTDFYDEITITILERPTTGGGRRLVRALVRKLVYKLHGGML